MTDTSVNEHGKTCAKVSPLYPNYVAALPCEPNSWSSVACRSTYVEQRMKLQIIFETPCIFTGIVCQFSSPYCSKSVLSRQRFMKFLCVAVCSVCWFICTLSVINFRALFALSNVQEIESVSGTSCSSLQPLLKRITEWVETLSNCRTDLFLQVVLQKASAVADSHQISKERFSLIKYIFILYTGSFSKR